MCVHACVYMCICMCECRHVHALDTCGSERSVLSSSLRCLPCLSQDLLFTSRYSNLVGLPESMCSASRCHLKIGTPKSETRPTTPGFTSVLEIWNLIFTLPWPARWQYKLIFTDSVVLVLSQPQSEAQSTMWSSMLILLFAVIFIFIRSWAKKIAEVARKVLKETGQVEFLWKETSECFLDRAYNRMHVVEAPGQVHTWTILLLAYSALVLPPSSALIWTDRTIYIGCQSNLFSPLMCGFVLVFVFVLWLRYHLLSVAPSGSHSDSSLNLSFNQNTSSLAPDFSFSPLKKSLCFTYYPY
jgi:hypothetical protein